MTTGQGRSGVSDIALKRASDALAVLALVAFVLAVLLGSAPVGVLGAALLVGAVQTTRVLRRRRAERRRQP